MCSAQPFLEEFIEEYGKCNKDIVHLKDGSMLSLDEFMAFVENSNELTSGVEGAWERERNFMRFHPKSGQEQNLERSALTYSIPIKSAEPFECLMIQITNEKELSSSSASFRRHVDSKSKDMEAAIRAVRQLVGLQLLSHAGDDDLKKLEAFRTLDPFDTHVSDTRFKLMAKALKRFSESSEFELGLEYSVKLLKCVAAVFSGGAKDSCVDMLAGIAKLLAKKFGKGSPSTYRVRIFASRCLNDTR